MCLNTDWQSVVPVHHKAFAYMQQPICHSPPFSTFLNRLHNNTDFILSPGELCQWDAEEEPLDCCLMASSSKWATKLHLIKITHQILSL